MLTLTEFFEAQATLNKRMDLPTERFATTFAPPKEFHPNVTLVEAGEWIDDMLKAMGSEMEELRNCTYWKHWCSEAQSGQRYKVKDVGAARNEVIDILHFWISLAQILGMSPEMVSDMYEAKLAKNIKRQDDGYSIEVKDLAWQLWRKHPCKTLVPGDEARKNAASFEDLPETAQTYYLDWAKNELKDECHITTIHCDCVSMDYYLAPDDPNDDSNPQPQPNPNCEKCGGSGYKLLENKDEL